MNETEQQIKDYMKRNPSAKWCPICGTIYLFRFAPVLTTLGLVLSAFIGWLIAIAIK